MRITTLEELLEALDELFDDGSDLTRRGAQDPWERVFSQPGHPLASDLPDACLVDGLPSARNTATSRFSQSGAPSRAWAAAFASAAAWGAMPAGWPGRATR